jgi:hypothetical protein
MPYESDAEAADEFSSVLADVVAIIDQFSDHCIVFGGDFNVDFDKHKIHSKLLRDVCNDNDLRFATLHNACSIDFTYNFNMDHFSFIDHFVVSASVFESTSVESCTVPKNVIRCSLKQVGIGRHRRQRGTPETLSRSSNILSQVRKA